jgi:hypothetical protein
MTPDDRPSDRDSQGAPGRERETDSRERRPATRESGTFDQAFAEPVDDQPTDGGPPADEDAPTGPVGADDAGATLDPGRALDALQSDDAPRVRALRLSISTLVVLGFVASLSAAAGGVVALGRWVIDAGLVGDTTMAAEQRLVAGVALLVPAASFLFLALYDDAELRRPAWPDGHPPLVDAWLLVLSAYGLVTLALATPGWPWAVRVGGWVAALLAAYGVVPVWLGWRCLAEPSWVLGLLAGLAALVVPVGATAVAVALLQGTTGPGGVATALVLALAGVAVPYGFAVLSPGPVPLSRAAAATLERATDRLRAAAGRLRATG